MKLALVLLGAAVCSATPRPRCRAIDLEIFSSSDAHDYPSAAEVDLLAQFARFTQNHVPHMLSEFKKQSQLKRTYNTIKDAVNEIVDNVQDELNEDSVDDTIKDAANQIIDAVKEQLDEDDMKDEDANDDTDNEDDDEDDTKDVDDPVEDKKIIEDSVKDIVDAIEKVLITFQEDPLSIDTIKAIAAGVIKGVSTILQSLSISLPDSILPDIPDVLPDVPDILPDSPTDLLPEWPSTDLADWPLLCKIVWWPKDKEKCTKVLCGACSTSMMAAARVCQATEGDASATCMSRVLIDGVCGPCAKYFTGN